MLSLKDFVVVLCMQKHGLNKAKVDRVDAQILRQVVKKNDYFK
jgi:hypothetical protein